MRVRASFIVGAVLVVAAVLPGAAARAAGSDTVPPDDPLDAIAVTRITGADRYEVAVHIAQVTRARSDVVYLASGADFPDALSAGPAVVEEQGALLLVAPTGLPSVVAAELVDLLPKRVVVVGGALSVPESVIAQVRALVPTAAVTRISGADRYEVSRRVTAAAFRSGAGDAYVATGATFPDALSAGPGAAADSAPLVLVDGSRSTLDPDTLALLRSLRTSWVGIAGGPASVSPGLEAALSGVVSTQRFSGADRYEVSQNINESLIHNWDTVYFATGATFPDALAGGVLAGSRGAPLFVVPSTCVPGAVLDSLNNHHVHNVVLLGGPLSLSDAVARLERC